MRSGGDASISVDVDIHLWQFDEVDVLAYAAQLIREHKGKREPEPGGYARDAWAKLDAAVEDLAKAVGYIAPIDEAAGFPYPASTAARITLEELRIMNKNRVCGTEAPA